MGEYGFIHQKLDIKILILFILRRLPENVTLETLLELRHIDNGIGYFDFIECLDELIATEHIREEDGLYTITEKGIRNGDAIESSLPYTVRKAAETAVDKTASLLRRNEMISAGHSENPQGGATVHLSLSDGVGEIMSLSLLCSGPGQAEAIEAKFRNDAESFYSRIMSVLTEQESDNII